MDHEVKRELDQLRQEVDSLNEKNGRSGLFWIIAGTIVCIPAFFTGNIFGIAVYGFGLGILVSAIIDRLDK